MDLTQVESEASEGLQDGPGPARWCRCKGALAIHHRVSSRLNYSWRCVEASAVQAHMKQGLPLAPGMEISYVVRDARRWEVDPERTAPKFDAMYYRGLLEKAWSEEAFFCTFDCQRPLSFSIVARAKSGLDLSEERTKLSIAQKANVGLI